MVIYRFIFVIPEDLAALSTLASPTETKPRIETQELSPVSILNLHPQRLENVDMMQN